MKWSAWQQHTRTATPYRHVQLSSMLMCKRFTKFMRGREAVAPDCEHSSPLTAKRPGRGVIFCSGAHWILGEIHSVYVVKSREQFGDVVRYRIGSLSVYQITHPDGVEQVLQTHHKKFRKGHFHHKIKLLADWTRGASNDFRISGNLIWLEAANL